MILAVAGAMSAAAQLPTFSVRTEEVRVDVLVTDHGKPVRGLTSADFEVRDSGVRQQIEFASFEQIPINAILAFDLSGSVAGERLDHLRGAGRALLDNLKKDDRAALVIFSHILALGSGLTTDLGRVRLALDQAQPFGNTSVIDASYAGLIVGESDAGRPLLIVFSDGLDTSSWLTSDEVLDTAKRGHAVVYSVSAGQLPNMTFLRDLSKFTGGSVFEVESTKNLGAVFLGILEEFRQRYLVTYEPRGVPKDGWHRIEVRVKGRNFTVKARPGYLKGL
ncbi:MAG: VWA domain-containing protein [Acidobacteriia bacterium]|nr:VWA domain-containing protein [Terriglobia bacterium]